MTQEKPQSKSEINTHCLASPGYDVFRPGKRSIWQASWQVQLPGSHGWQFRPADVGRALEDIYATLLHLKFQRPCVSPVLKHVAAAFATQILALGDEERGVCERIQFMIQKPSALKAFEARSEWDGGGLDCENLARQLETIIQDILTAERLMLVQQVV